MATTISMPVKNRAAMQGVQQANDISVQQMAGQAGQAISQGAPVNLGEAAQAGGAAITAGTGKKQVAEAAQAVETQKQAGNVALQKQELGAQKDVASRKLALDNQQLINVQALSALDERLKQDLFDKNMQFQQDESGRVFLNERQLADWAKTKAQSVEEFKNYAQKAQQEYDRKNAMLKMAHDKVLLELDANSKKAISEHTQAMQKRLLQAKINLEKSIRENSAAAAESSARWAGIGGIGGAVAGGVIGSFAGGNTITGAVAGYAGGTAVGGSMGPTIEGTA